VVLFRISRTSQALDILRWITAQAAEDGGLPEQLCEDLYSQKECKQWETQMERTSESFVLWSMPCTFFYIVA
jgi:GH15 family glucan-1,4-alpha-glucosidase